MTMFSNRLARSSVAGVGRASSRSGSLSRIAGIGRTSRSGSFTDPSAMDGPAASQLDEISGRHILVVRNMRSPPMPIVHLFEVVVLMIENQRDERFRNGVPNWPALKKRLDENLIIQMKTFRPAQLSNDHRKWLNSTYFDERVSGQYLLTYDRVRNAHPVIAPVFNWCVAILRPPGVKAPAMAVPSVRSITEPTKPRSSEKVRASPLQNRSLRSQENVMNARNDISEKLTTKERRTPPPLPPLPSTMTDVTTLNSARVETCQFRNLPQRHSIKEDAQEVLLYALTGQDPSKSTKKSGPCDKCDGPHHESVCPHFKKPRDDHKDATMNLGKANRIAKQEALLNKKARGRKIPQPGDGSCLFHSLSYGLRSGQGATQIRQAVADFVAAHPTAEVAGTPLQDWVKWDAGMSVDRYGAMMRSGSRWGGAIEMAVFAHMNNVRVEVWQPIGSGVFKCIAGFGESSKVINVCYSGGVHYDGLALS